MYRFIITACSLCVFSIPVIFTSKKKRKILMVKSVHLCLELNLLNSSLKWISVCFSLFPGKLQNFCIMLCVPQMIIFSVNCTAFINL